jgi:outer membrane protein assembly factor BamB
MFAGPTLAGELVLVTSDSGQLVALHRDDGREAWQFSIDQPLRCAATVVDGQTMLAGCDAVLHIVRVADGQRTAQVAIDGPSGCTPAASGGRVFLGTEEGSFHAFSKTSDNQLEQAWVYKDNRRKSGIRTSAAVNDKLAVFASEGRTVYAVDVATGKLEWEHRMRQRVSSSPVIAGSRVVVLTERGEILLLDLANGKPITETTTGGSYKASPVVVDGKLIAANANGKLICLGSK